MDFGRKASFNTNVIASPGEARQSLVLRLLRSLRFLAMTVLLNIFGLVIADFASSEMIQRLDAHVIQVDSDRRQLVVQFQHPVSGELVRKEFSVAENAGFKRVKKLNQVKKGDLVTVDYREEGSHAVAIYVDVVPLERQPVSAVELAASVVKIKSAQKSLKA